MIRGRKIPAPIMELTNHRRAQTPIIAGRKVFSDVTKKSFHGEQSFSPDEGKSWETNWIEDFTRTGS
jgi:hypothetical protein